MKLLATLLTLAPLFSFCQCTELDIKIDKFTRDTTYANKITISIDNNGKTYALNTIVSAKENVLYLSTYVGDICVNDQSELVFLRSDQTTIKYPNLYGIDCGGSLVVKLDKEDLKDLINIEAFRLVHTKGSEDREFRKKDIIKIKKLLECASNKLR